MAEFQNSEAICHVQLDALLKLKNSTKQLLRLVEEIQSKTHTSHPIPDDPFKLSAILNEHNQSPATLGIDEDQEPDDTNASAYALQRLEEHAKRLDSIDIQNEDDDCSVYKRLTRKCTCLNRSEFNDFIIHFNEDMKSCTSTLGEIIKNLRILKKFLYMGGAYTRNSLLFLNEGLQKSTHPEKVDIIQACAHADICNVFDDESIVTACILGTFRIDGFGDVATQSSTSTFLYKLAEVEEGRRYLNYSTKISNDIKKVLKKKSSALSEQIVEQLHATLSLLNPQARHLNVTYYCKAEEGMGFRTLNSLELYRDYMTLEEVITHLDWLNSFSEHDKGRTELTQYLPNLLRIFKSMLVQYDNSEINIFVTSILNNLVAKRMKVRVHGMPPSSPEFIVANMSTEPIPMKEVFMQVPSLKLFKSKKERPALGLKSKNCPQLVNSKGKEPEFPKSILIKPETANSKMKSVGRLGKRKEKGASNVIIVPLERKHRLAAV